MIVQYESPLGRSMLKGGADTTGQSGLEAPVSDARAAVAAPIVAAAPDRAAVRQLSRPDSLSLPPSLASAPDRLSM
jgi:hypothetical protein